MDLEIHEFIKSSNLQLIILKVFFFFWWRFCTFTVIFPPLWCLFRFYSLKPFGVLGVKGVVLSSISTYKQCLSVWGQFGSKWPKLQVYSCWKVKKIVPSGFVFVLHFFKNVLNGDLKEGPVLDLTLRDRQTGSNRLIWNGSLAFSGTFPGWTGDEPAGGICLLLAGDESARLELRPDPSPGPEASVTAEGLGVSGASSDLTALGVWGWIWIIRSSFDADLREKTKAGVLRGRLIWIWWHHSLQSYSFLKVTLMFWRRSRRRRRRVIWCCCWSSQWCWRAAWQQLTPTEDVGLVITSVRRLAFGFSDQNAAVVPLSPNIQMFSESEGREQLQG